MKCEFKKKNQTCYHENWQSFYIILISLRDAYLIYYQNQASWLNASNFKPKSVSGMNSFGHVHADTFRFAPTGEMQKIVNVERFSDVIQFYLVYFYCVISLTK